MFAIGQRWISDTEPDLGLGIVQEVRGRYLEMYFPAVDEVRCYAPDNAPLRRIRFRAGDRIDTPWGEMVVSRVEEQDGLLFYVDGDRRLPETRLSDRIKVSQAVERFFVGLLDKNKDYELRLDARYHQARLQANPLRGLLGARIELLPHQLYIAREVSDREFPRVLLADEVGLGKTIEAGLIIHRLLLGERVRRVLVLTPDNLLHQWLVEMLRRFNLVFSLLDEPRCQALEKQTEGHNPFLQQQLVLASLDHLRQYPERCRQVAAGEWDLVVVDEAHHLRWQSSGVPPDPAYRLLEQIGGRCRGLLLLTATPEQLGVSGHFARLRLLDPDRFPDLSRFLREQEDYRPVADAARGLLEQRSLQKTQAAELRRWLGEEVPRQPDPDQRRTWIRQLVDRHGTGRVLFRNSRAVISGFPQRHLHPYRLLLPEQYQPTAMGDGLGPPALEALLYPERSVVNWTRYDPRIDWLRGLLSSHPGEKVLLICHQVRTVQEIHESLRVRHGLHCPVFHEGMSVVERDRAAAYFADREAGAQLLLCSEIGSEGRNFQFARHLVLFDLPLDCDLLEQRIGRLDRIGQEADIGIHVPYFGDHATEQLLNVYDRAFDLFSRVSPAAQPLMDEYRGEIRRILLDSTTVPAVQRAERTEDLVRILVPRRMALEASLQRGRDRLLELNSCDPQQADHLVREVRREEQAGAGELRDFLDRVCDAFGVEQEEDGAHSFILRPGDHMRVAQFPHLPEDGMTCTLTRELAVAREDMQWLTWEHPLVTSALDLILHHETGNSCLTYLPRHEHHSGDFYLQMQFLLVCHAPYRLQLQRYLAGTTLYLTRMPNGKLRRGRVRLAAELRDMPERESASIVRDRYTDLRRAVDQMEQAALGLVPELLAGATQDMQGELQGEIERLTQLRKYNPNVRQLEIDALKEKRTLLGKYIGEARLHTDSVRVIFCA